MLARKVHFSCMHKYENAEWTAEKNREVFGACYSTYGHGHDYTLEAWFSGKISEDTGMIINLTDIDALLKLVTEPLQGKHLNFEVPAFQSKNPTTENLLEYLKENLEEQTPTLGNIHLEKLRLYEYEDLWVDWVSK